MLWVPGLQPNDDDASYSENADPSANQQLSVRRRVLLLAAAEPNDLLRSHSCPLLFFASVGFTCTTVARRLSFGGCVRPQWGWLQGPAGPQNSRILHPKGCQPDLDCVPHRPAAHAPCGAGILCRASRPSRLPRALCHCTVTFEAVSEHWQSTCFQHSCKVRWNLGVHCQWDMSHKCFGGAT